jgi:hypothetical protein
MKLKKNKFNHIKGFKTKIIIIKRMRIKIKIKNKLEDNYKFFIQKKNQFNKRIKKRTKLKKITYDN